LWENHDLDTKMPLTRTSLWKLLLYRVLKKPSLSLQSHIIVGTGHNPIYLSDIYKASIYLLSKIA